MPKIPSYQLQQVSIPGPGSVPQPRATAVQCGGLQAEGLQRTGQKITLIYTFQKSHQSKEISLQRGLLNLEKLRIRIYPLI